MLGRLCAPRFGARSATTRTCSSPTTMTTPRRPPRSTKIHAQISVPSPDGASPGNVAGVRFAPSRCPRSALSASTLEASTICDHDFAQSCGPLLQISGGREASRKHSKHPHFEPDNRVGTRTPNRTIQMHHAWTKYGRGLNMGVDFRSGPVPYGRNTTTHEHVERTQIWAWTFGIIAIILIVIAAILFNSNNSSYSIS